MRGAVAGYSLSPVVNRFLPPQSYLSAAVVLVLAMAICAALGILMRGFRVDWHGGYCYCSPFTPGVFPSPPRFIAPPAQRALSWAWAEGGGHAEHFWWSGVVRQVRPSPSSVTTR